MSKAPAETYERIRLSITEFEKEDVITTSSTVDTDKYEGVPLMMGR